MSDNDIQTGTPLLIPYCRELGQHWLIQNGVALCDCRKAAVPVEGDVDDLGDHVLRQTRVRRDRYNRSR